MADRYATVDEVKAILKITDTDSDLLIDSLLDAAAELLHAIVGVDSFVLTEYVDEPVKGSNSNWLMVNNKPLVAITDITDEQDNDVTYTIKRYKNRQAYFDESFSSQYTYLVTYSAGYVVNDTIELLSNDDLNNKTISVRTLYAATAVYTLKTELTIPAVAGEILIGDDLAETLENIAAAIDGTTVDDEIITFGPDADVSTTMTDEQATLTVKTIPKTVKLVIAYLMGGLMSEENSNPSVQSYSIGQKSVTFRNSLEGNIAQRIINTWLVNLNKAQVYASK